IENLIDLMVKVIRCDNGTKFKNRIMNQFCEIKGIKREFSVSRTLQQNGVAERKNKTLIEAARTMLTNDALFSSHKKHKNSRHHLATSDPPLTIDYSDDIVINDAVLKALDILKSATMTSPPLLEFGSPLDEKMMITDSPYLVTNCGEDDSVDEAAEFIRRFYNDRRREN
ncbi:putative ribonuclease H-like domain-containing protein, partial [Tanacetum coccineum]